MLKIFLSIMFLLTASINAQLIDRYAKDGQPKGIRTVSKQNEQGKYIKFQRTLHSPHFTDYHIYISTNTNAIPFFAWAPRLAKMSTNKGNTFTLTIQSNTSPITDVKLDGLDLIYNGKRFNLFVWAFEGIIQPRYVSKGGKFVDRTFLEVSNMIWVDVGHRAIIENSYVIDQLINKPKPYQTNDMKSQMEYITGNKDIPAIEVMYGQNGITTNWSKFMMELRTRGLLNEYDGLIPTNGSFAEAESMYDQVKRKYTTWQIQESN
ncbi:MAG: hypothetical protein ACRCY4_01535 [Brevinema sp.]